MNQAHAAPDEPVRLTVLQDSEIKTIVLTPQDRLLTLKNLPASDF